MPVRCDDLARVLSASTDGEALDERANLHVESCLRCQAELAQYRKLIKVLHTLRTEVLSPGPSLAADILAGLEQAGERSAVRSLLSGRRPAVLGGAAMASAAAVGAGAILVLRSRERHGSR
ncbi:MAG: hypothetical protein WD232_04315 [Acidimicrobiales bacterium]